MTSTELFKEPFGSLESLNFGYSFGKESFEATNAISCFLSTVENICRNSVIKYFEKEISYEWK